MPDKFVIAEVKRAQADLTLHAASQLELAFVGNGVTQAYMASLLGVSQVAVSKAINNPSLNDVARIAWMTGHVVRLELIKIDLATREDTDSVVWYDPDDENDPADDGDEGETHG